MKKVSGSVNSSSSTLLIFKQVCQARPGPEEVKKWQGSSYSSWDRYCGSREDIDDEKNFRPEVDAVVFTKALDIDVLNIEVMVTTDVFII